MSNAEDLCQMCAVPDVEYESPAKLCQSCWYEWWFVGLFDADTLAKAKREWDEFLEGRKHGMGKR